MGSFKVLLSALILTLLALTVDSSSGSYSNYNYDLSGQALTDLYNSRVQKAERMKRPLEGTSSILGPISHSGVRVTLDDGSQWLVHKGAGYGLSSQTVLTDAQHMSSAWQPVSSREFQGSRTVSDFVSAGGPDYSLLFDNCHLGSRRMMKQ